MKNSFLILSMSFAFVISIHTKAEVNPQLEKIIMENGVPNHLAEALNKQISLSKAGTGCYSSSKKIDLSKSALACDYTNHQSFCYGINLSSGAVEKFPVVQGRRNKNMSPGDPSRFSKKVASKSIMLGPSLMGNKRKRPSHRKRLLEKYGMSYYVHVDFVSNPRANNRGLGLIFYPRAQKGYSSSLGSPVLFGSKAWAFVDKMNRNSLFLNHANGHAYNDDCGKPLRVQEPQNHRNALPVDNKQVK